MRPFVILTAVTLALAKTFDWNCLNSLGTCNNACFAINCKNAPDLLTYDSEEVHRPLRRKESGCSRTPCSNEDLPYLEFGKSCDEYPFASTLEGGTGAILRCVLESENSSEGGQLGNFYGSIDDGDQFDITMKNHGGADFCDDPTNCDNDGGEFELDNTDDDFVDARRSEETVLFVPAKPNSSKVRIPFRKFMGSDGVTRSWLNKSTNRTLVGKYVWNGVGGKVEIVAEIFS